MVKAYTYYEPLGHDYVTLIGLWKKSFEDYGYDAVILGRRDAECNPRHDQWMRHVENLPTINNRAFEVSCWRRWLAFEMCDPGLFCDFDVINYGYSNQKIDAGFKHLGCMVVESDQDGIKQFVDQFPSAGAFIVDGHMSDMVLLNILHGNGTDMCANISDCKSKNSPMVHFSNAHLPPEWRFVNRYKAVNNFTKLRTSHGS